MMIFGLHSTFFDMITFFTLYKLLSVSPHIFQTGWFLESTLTELCILFALRSQKNFFQSNPKKSLIWLTLLAAFATVAMIYVPFAEKFDMYRLPLQVVIAVSIIIFFYIVTADILKKFFFRRINKIA